MENSKNVSTSIISINLGRDLNTHNLIRDPLPLERVGWMFAIFIDKNTPRYCVCSSSH